MRFKASRLTALLCCAAVAASGIANGFSGLTDTAVIANAAVTTQCTTYSGRNTNAQNYSTWAYPIESYLTTTSNGQLMRFQEDAVSGKYLIEYYNTYYNIKSTKLVDAELSIFGGFYESADNYYVVSGQYNNNESAEVECFRITKYDKSWNRISSVGVYDCNTTVPFDAGSVRFAEYGKYLVVRTAHEMYESSDGLNHQSNFTIVVDTENMTATSKTVAYASHSFNQFVQVDGSNIAFVDHGDAYPRSIVIEMGTINSNGSISTNKEIDILNFPGETGQNATGASIGGFEYSDTSYIVAYNSVIQDEKNTSRFTRNIYISVIDKTTDEISIKQITNTADGGPTSNTPHLVKLSDNSFMLLWSDIYGVSYVTLDGKGNLTSEICSIEGAYLSDCAPLVNDGKVIWYTWNNGTVTFYDIATSGLEANETVIENGHELVYTYPEEGDNVCTSECKNCDFAESFTTPTDFITFWNQTGAGSYSSWVSSKQCDGANLYFYIPSSYVEPSDAQRKFFDIESSDSDIAKVNTPSTTSTGSITFVGKGTVTITITPTYNPNVKKTYTFEVGDHVDAKGDGLCDNCPKIMDGIGAQLAGYTVSLDGNVGVNFHMLLDSSVLADEQAYMQFTVGDNEPVKVMVSDAKTSTVTGKQYYVFPVDVPAKDMTTEIKAQMITSNGNGTVFTYTVAEYSKQILSSSSYSDSTKALVKALLNYGAAAQTYFGYNTDKLANSILNESDRTVADSDTLTNETAYAVSSSIPDGISYYGTSLLLKSETTLRHYFKLEEGKSLSDYSITVTNGTDSVEYTTGTKSGLCYIDICNINALDLATGYVVSIDGYYVFEQGKEASVMRFAKLVCDSASTSAEYKAVAKAIAAYCDAAVVNSAE